jgi:hypothetical protein
MFDSPNTWVKSGSGSVDCLFLASFMLVIVSCGFFLLIYVSHNLFETEHLVKSLSKHIHGQNEHISFFF